MKKRLLFILIVFIAWLPVFVIQKPVFMFYQHALSETCTFTDFLQVMLHGLKLDCTIAGYLTAIPLLLTLASVWLPGAWLKKVLKGYFLIMGNSGIGNLLRRCGFIQLLGIQVGRYFILLPPIACRCDGECSVGIVLYPIIGIRGICARYLCLVHLHPPVRTSKA